MLPYSSGNCTLRGSGLAFSTRHEATGPCVAAGEAAHHPTPPAEAQWWRRGGVSASQLCGPTFTFLMPQIAVGVTLS